MKNLFLSVVLLLTVSFAFATNDAEIVSLNNDTIELTNSLELNEVIVTIDDLKKSCTVTYTNSAGVTFSSTAETCTEAYENLSMHIEAQ